MSSTSRPRSATPWLPIQPLVDVMVDNWMARSDARSALPSAPAVNDDRPRLRVRARQALQRLSGLITVTPRARKEPAAGPGAECRPRPA